MAFHAAVIGSLRSTAYSVTAQVRASTTALTALRMYEDAVLHRGLGESIGLHVRVGDVVEVARLVVGDHVRVTVNGEERGDAGDPVLDVAVHEDTAVAGERVVEEEVERAEGVDRHGELVDDVVDRDALHLRAGVERRVATTGRVVELALLRPRDHGLGGREAAVDARVTGGSVEREAGGRVR